MIFYFENSLNGEKDLGEEWRYKFPKFGVQAESPEEAERLWKEWTTDFKKRVKAKKNPPTDLPFESPKEVAGIKMFKTEDLENLSIKKK